MAEFNTDDMMSLTEFKHKFGHYYSYIALKEMTGVKEITNVKKYYKCYIPTYKTYSKEVWKYYDDLTKEFSLLYNRFGRDYYNEFIENLSWRNYNFWNDNPNEEWYYGIQPQHILILKYIKNGDIDKLRNINTVEHYYIEFYKDCMIKVAIDNEQIESIDYLIKTKQINNYIESYLENTSPQFYDKLVSKYNIKFMQEQQSNPGNELYLFYSNMHWIDPEETYLNLKYPRIFSLEHTELNEEEYKNINSKLLLHIIEKYEIDENHMCSIIKRLENSHRYICYCLINNKISDLKYFFENEYLENKWDQRKVFNIVRACINYNCLELLDSIKIIEIYEYDKFNYESNLKFYKKEIKKILKNDNEKLELIKQKYDTIFHNFENICVE